LISSVPSFLQRLTVNINLHESSVMQKDMKNITFSAEESLIEKARKKARSENTSLNKRFREWLKFYATRGESDEDYKSIMEELNYAVPGKKFSRDELNER